MPPVGLFREQKQDHRHRVAALLRMVEVAQAHQQQQPTKPHGDGQPRVLIAHQQAWFAGALTRCLRHQDVDVVAVVTDGADAVGLAVAAQPDAVLLAAALLRMSSLQVLRDLQTFAPRVRVIVQVAQPNAIPGMLQAGATAAWPRTRKPEQAAADLALLLRATGPGREQ